MKQSIPEKLSASGIVVQFPFNSKHALSSARGFNSSDHSGGDGGDGDMEKRIAILEVEVAYIKKEVAEIKATVVNIDSNVNSIDKNMALVLEKLSTIKESLDKKPSIDSVDKKISDAKLAVLLGVPAIMTIITALYKAAQHYL